MEDTEGAAATAATMARLRRISLVARVAGELEAATGVNSRDLAEFVIHLAEGAGGSFAAFEAALEANGGVLDAGLARRIHGVVAAEAEAGRRAAAEAEAEAEAAAAAAEAAPAAPSGPATDEARRFPGLAMPDRPLTGEEDLPPPPPPPPPEEPRQPLKRKREPAAEARPAEGRVYAGTVCGVKDFGVFVELSGLAGRFEG